MNDPLLNFRKNPLFENTMIPDKRIRFLRKCVIFQFIRFTIINIKMLIVVSKSH
jgi:hypothetical protein